MQNRYVKKLTVLLHLRGKLDGGCHTFHAQRVAQLMLYRNHCEIQEFVIRPHPRAHSWVGANRLVAVTGSCICRFPRQAKPCSFWFIF